MDGDETPQIKKYFWLNGISAIVFWVCVEAAMRGPGLILQSILKFSVYLSVIIWLNTVFYLSKCAEGIEVERGEFQREQVKLTLWIVGILILMELPLMISVI